MENARRTVLFALAMGVAALGTVAPAAAIDQSRSAYNALVAQAQNGQRDRVPASYRIVQNDKAERGMLTGSSRYYGGEIRTLIVDGRPVRLSEREIIENIRTGRFVPVYAETGTRLSREDWEGSLPHWLGGPTREFAAP